MNTSDIRADGAALLLGTRRIDLPYPVSKVLRHGDLVIVMLEPPPKVVFNRNVMAFTRSGELAWQIQESPHGTESDKPYVGLNVDSSGELVASNWNGVDYVLSVETGSIRVQAFKK